MEGIIRLLNGLVGFFIAVILVVIAACVVGYNAIRVQQNEATSYYKIDAQSLQKNNVDNKNAITNAKDTK